MGRSNFKMRILKFWLQICIPLKKVWIESILLLFIFWSKILEKKASKDKIVLLFELTLFFGFDCIFDSYHQNIKKIRLLLIHTFLSGIQICNQNFKILILTVPYRILGYRSYLKEPRHFPHTSIAPPTRIGKSELCRFSIMHTWDTL